MIRIGQGFDVHALVPGRRLIIGGVDIPHDKGLLGHSDADVLLHAITDALLGAAALGDIGSHFPDTDERWRGADSRVLLRATVGLLAQAGCASSTSIRRSSRRRRRWRLHSGDDRNIAADLLVAGGDVNVKGQDLRTPRFCRSR